MKPCGVRIRALVVAAFAFELACDEGRNRAEAPPDHGALVRTSHGVDAADRDPRDDRRDPLDASPTRVSEPSIVLGPDCDEDNPVTTGPEGTTDRSLPADVVQFERRLGWGCAHRHYHDTRQWDFLARDPSQADRFAYVQKMKWTRPAMQEGAPGSGLDFLAMHRAMLGALRNAFPEHADLFEGWTAVPIASTDDDPVPLASSVSGAFWPTMQTAASRLETDLESFVSDDELGIYIETQHRPTAADPLARSLDRTSGLHTYLHLRFDDPASPIRMNRFSRNLESVTFFRLHGFIDRVWSRYRAMKGATDTDAAYAEAMHHACMHMGLMSWDAAKSTCAP